MTAEWIGFLTTAAAALLASGGYLYRVRDDRRRCARRALYQLLEIRHAVVSATFDPVEDWDVLMDQYISRASHRGLPLRREEIPQDLRGIVVGFFRKTESSINEAQQDRLIGPYEQSLVELASTHPVLAYRLRGNERVFRLRQALTAYRTDVVETVMQQLPAQWAKEAMVAAADMTQASVFKEVIASVDKNLKELSAVCGWTDRRKCRQAIERMRRQVAQDQLAEFNPLIDGVLDILLDAALRQQVAPNPPVGPL